MSNPSKICDPLVARARPGFRQAGRASLLDAARVGAGADPLVAVAGVLAGAEGARGLPACASLGRRALGGGDAGAVHRPSLYHSMLGVQVVIEDYVTAEGAKTVVDGAVECSRTPRWRQRESSPC